MTTAIKHTESGASAPVQAPSVVESVDELFPVRKLKTRAIHLPDMDKTITFEELRPKDYEEVNHAAVSYEGGTPKLDNRMWNARLVAMSIRIRGVRAWKDEQGWRVMALRISETWTISDLQLAAEGVAELSGISKKAREALEAILGKGSNETETDTSSTQSQKSTD